MAREITNRIQTINEELINAQFYFTQVMKGMDLTEEQREELTEAIYGYVQVQEMVEDMLDY